MELNDRFKIAVLQLFRLPYLFFFFYYFFFFLLLPKKGVGTTARIDQSRRAAPRRPRRQNHGAEKGESAGTRSGDGYQWQWQWQWWWWQWQWCWSCSNIADFSYFACLTFLVIGSDVPFESWHGQQQYYWWQFV
jgi:hypothetical protein